MRKLFFHMLKSFLHTKITSAAAIYGSRGGSIGGEPDRQS